jgi:hypothetical protein
MSTCGCWPRWLRRRVAGSPTRRRPRRRGAVIAYGTARGNLAAGDPLGTIPLFGITATPTPARDASPRHDALAILAGLAVISDRRRDLDQHEHDLIVAARDAGATWRQIAASLGISHRQAAQQRHRSLGRLINAGKSAEPLEDVI